MRLPADSATTSWRRALAGVVLVAAVLALGACGGDSKSSGDTTTTGVKGASEKVQAEPVSTAGPNPFTASVGKDKTGVKPPQQASAGGPSAYKGSLPGLYGGTMDHTTCDSGKLISFLEATPDKATAWAETLNIKTTDIRDYMGRLTAVTLRTDTRVTNHGFVGGRANPIQSVLQAGTAVFVNEYGAPVVKCYCGNPLTPPVTFTSPIYTGPTWPGFSPSHITIIEQSTTIINEYSLYDLANGGIFTRPAGTDGSQDTPSGGGTATTPAPAPTTPPSTPTQPTTTQAQPSESPSASFSPNPGRQGDTFVLSASGFTPGATLDVSLTRPDGGQESYSISIGADGSGSHTFPPGSPVTGTYSAVVTNPATGASTQASVQVDRRSRSIRWPGRCRGHRARSNRPRRRETWVDSRP